MKEKFIKLAKENVLREGINDLLKYLEEETDFYTAPASTKYHGSYKGGLLEHSINVFNELKDSKYINNYSKETLTLVSLFHDICKANIYKVEIRNTKKDGDWIQVPYFSVDEKFPFGHGEKSVYLINKFIKLTDEEALAIRWHMGGFTDSVKGGSYSLSKAFENILALELHIADMRATYILENK